MNSPAPYYPVLGADLELKFRYLRWTAIAAPVVMVVVLEVVRTATDRIDVDP